MKLLDCHTHFFPDENAARYVKMIEENCGIKARSDGRLSSQIANMDKEGVALSVNAPVTMNPEKVGKVNRMMVEFNKKQHRVISFGSMHPKYGNYGDFGEEIKFLADSGIKGIKMHPEYQDFYPDDGIMKGIYEACIKNNIIVMFHSGADAAYDFYSTHGTPKRMAQVAETYKELKLILAHLGGFRMWDGVYRNLVGKNVYLDTALAFELDDEGMKNIITEHGVDRILFGSDYPWGGPLETKQRIEKIIEKEEDREKIFHLNAEKMLKI